MFPSKFTVTLIFDLMTSKSLGVMLNLHGKFEDIKSGVDKL